jgi:hypothetical protein
MRAAALQEILSGIDALSCDEIAKGQFRHVVSTVGNQHGVKLVVRCERLNFIRRLLSENVPRLTVRDRVIACYQVHKRTADRSIEKVLHEGRRR